MDDLSPRARDVLGHVGLIAVEDTRHTGAMLKRLGISVPMVSNHAFNERARVDRLLEAMAVGDVALVSDSGTPAVSDPGAILVRAAVDAGYPVVPIPGPSAVTAAVSASGLVDGAFLFLGFLPRASNEHRTALTSGLATTVPLILFETGPRISALAEILAELAPIRKVAVFRELTKLHEESIHAVASDLPARLLDTTLKGEFVIVLGGATTSQPELTDQHISERLETGDRPSDVARDLAQRFGCPRSEVYERIMRLQRTRNRN